MLSIFSFTYKIRGLRGRKSSPRGWIAPYRKFKYLFFLVSLSDANDTPPWLNGTVGGAPIISPFLQGTRARQ
ncbi:MAG: hypothetical protein RXQ78_04635 [Sulfolobaceae archaeon]